MISFWLTELVEIYDYPDKTFDPKSKVVFSDFIKSTRRSHRRRRHHRHHYHYHLHRLPTVLGGHPLVEKFVTSRENVLNGQIR